MARTGRPKAELVLTGLEREELERYARRPKTRAGACAAGQDRAGVRLGRGEHRGGRAAGVTVQTVGKWRARFVERRLAGLLDEPRPGQPRKITDEHVEDVIVRTLETKPPDGGTHWSTRKMAAATGLNQTAVSKIWRAFGLQPHRVEQFKLSKDPLFIEKVRDIVGVYLDPPERAVVLCVDEKSQIQALDRSAPILPLLAGVPERRTHDYKRAGHQHPVRRAGPRDRPGHRLTAPTPPRGRVQEVPPNARPRGPRRARGPPDPRQLRHPQDAGDPEMADPRTPALSCTSPRPAPRG